MNIKLTKEQKKKQEQIRVGFMNLLSSGISQRELAKHIGLHEGNLSKFLAGTQALSPAVTDLVIERKIVDLNANKEVTGELLEYAGEVITVKDAAADKGRSEATIRKYAKEGKLNFVKVGRKIMICKNSLYSQLPETELARLRKQVTELQAQVVELQEKLETVEEETFSLPDSEYDDDLDGNAGIEYLSPDDLDDLPMSRGKYYE